MPTVALVDLFGYRHGWLGSGVFWHLAQRFYACDKFCVAPHADVRRHANATEKIWYSMEKLAWAGAPIHADWVLVKDGKQLDAAQSNYDILILISRVLKVAEHLNPQKVTVLVDEPPPHTMPSNLLATAARLGVRENIIAHFPFPGARLVPPIYDANAFARMQVPPRARTAFFVQKRCEYAAEIQQQMSAKGLQHRREAWRDADSSSYAHFYGELGASRWAFALDRKMSAGQIVAEASLLGVPVFSYDQKPNARGVLPRALLVDARMAKDEALVHMWRTIRAYENETAYAQLCKRVKRAARAKFRASPRLLQMPNPQVRATDFDR